MQDPIRAGMYVLNGEQRNLRLATMILRLLSEGTPVVVIDAERHFSQQVRMLSGQLIYLPNTTPVVQQFGESPFYLFEIQAPMPLDALLDSVKFHCNHLTDAVICVADADQLPGYFSGGELLPRLQSESRAPLYLTWCGQSPSSEMITQHRSCFSVVQCAQEDV